MAYKRTTKSKPKKKGGGMERTGGPIHVWGAGARETGGGGGGRGSGDATGRKRRYGQPNAGSR